MKKPPSPQANPGSMDEADPRFIPVAEALGAVPGFALMESKSGATRGLMLDGKSFGMSSHGRLILKLTEARAAELIEEGIAGPFHPSPGRSMKGWIEVSRPDADWVALAREAYTAAVAGAKNPRTSSSPRSSARTSR